MWCIEELGRGGCGSRCAHIGVQCNGGEGMGANSEPKGHPCGQAL